VVPIKKKKRIAKLLVRPHKQLNLNVPGGIFYLKTRYSFLSLSKQHHIFGGTIES